MSTYLKKFNQLCEEQEIDIFNEGIITEGLFNLFKKRKWSLESEFKVILPSITKKIKLAFKNINEGKPGELEISGDPTFTAIDEGTQTPGFKVQYILNDNYTKNNLFPFLKEIEHFSEQNDKFHFFEQSPPFDAYVIAEINVNDTDIDLSDSNIKIPALSIKSWAGDLYLNFKCTRYRQKKK